MHKVKELLEMKINSENCGWFCVETLFSAEHSTGCFAPLVALRKSRRVEC
jgi:hypothetical protein